MSEASTLVPEREKGDQKKGANPAPQRSSLRALIDQGAQDWGVTPKTVILICSMPVIFTLIAAICALMGKEAYKWWTGEDQFGEYLQVVFWTICLILSVMVVKNKLREGDNIFAILYLLLSCGVIFIIGEEISWGQRIFGWITPESLKQINKQAETNLHNIHGVGSTFKWMHLIIGAYGTFVPLIAMRATFLQRFRRELTLLVPHFTLIPYFAFIFFWRSYRNLFEAPKKYYFAISEFSEVTELALSLAFALFVAFQLRQMKSQTSQSATSRRSLNQINRN